MIHALHGNLGSPRDWDALGLENLRSIDLWSWQEKFPGMTLEEFGEAFANEMAAIDPEPILLGYSLGGRLALHAMAARPNLWKAAILVSTHPGLKTEEERLARRELDRQWAQKAREGEWLEFLVEWNAQPVLAGDAAIDRQKRLISGRNAIAGAFESWSLGAQEPMEEALNACHFPILAIAGERDSKFSGLLNCLPGTAKQVIGEAGHRILLDQPKGLGMKVRKWLENLG